MSLRRLKVLSNYGEDTFQWWRIHPRISIGGIRYRRYIKSASCTSCSVVPWFFSTPGCTCVRQVSIHSDFCSVGAPPPAPFSIFRFRCLLDRRKKPCRVLHVAFNFLFSTIRDVFGSGWKKGRKKKKKKRSCPLSSHDSSKNSEAASNLPHCLPRRYIHLRFVLRVNRRFLPPFPLVHFPR